MADTYDPLMNLADAEVAVACGEECRAFAYSLQINISVGNAEVEADSPRLRALLEAFERELVAFDLRVARARAGRRSSQLSSLEARIDSVLEEFPGVTPVRPPRYRLRASASPGSGSAPVTVQCLATPGTRR